MRAPRPAATGKQKQIAAQSPVLLEAEAAAYLRIVSALTLETWRSQPPKGGAPRHVKAGSRIGYLKSELDRWLESRLRYSTSDEKPAAEAAAAEGGRS